jgi:cobyrinic acid a,c-diamide synthase
LTDGLIIAAPASESGKALVTLGHLGALARAGLAVAFAKACGNWLGERRG